MYNLDSLCNELKELLVSSGYHNMFELHLAAGKGNLETVTGLPKASSEWPSR